MQALADGENLSQEGQDPLLGEKRSWHTLLAGSLLFVIWGLEMISGELAFSIFGAQSTYLLAAYKLLSWLVFLLPPVVVAVAWTRNFPRWTYAYVGSAFVYTYFLAVNAVATPQSELLGNSPNAYLEWSWRAWIPLVLALCVGLAITRSLRPLLHFFTNAWLDWTLLSYAMFGWVPFLLLASFDEVAAALTMIFMPIVTIILFVASTGYLASRSIFQRAISLIAGAFFSIGLTLVVMEIYWSGIGAFNSARLILILTLFLGVLFSPALIGVIRHFRGQSAVHQS